MDPRYMESPPQGLAGIGLLMQQDGGPQSKVFIKNVVPGGACHRDGMIQVNDFVIGVNGQSAVGLPVAEIRERIVGPIGSSVRVTFERPTGEVFERVLTRGNAPTESRTEIRMEQHSSSQYTMSRSMDGRGLSMSTSAIPGGASINDSEMARMRLRIGELESELTICKDELSRARNLIDADKDTSMRYVKEIDSVQRKNQDENLNLRGMLNSSEQARRELEIQLAAATSREEDFHQRFQRAKEQTEAREQYFADLKRKFEDLQGNFDKDMARERESKAEVERHRVLAESNMEKMKQELERFKDMERTRREKEEGVRKLLHESEAKLAEAKVIEEKIRAQGQALHLMFGQWQKDFFSNKSKEESELEQYFLA